MGIVLAIASAGAISGCAAGFVSEPGEGGGGEGGDVGPSGPGPSGPSATGAGGQGGAPPPTPCETASQCGAFAGPCSLGACVNGMCEAAPANQFGACDDGLFCTEDDTCQDGACVGGTQKFCESLDSCHLGVCDEELDTCKNIVGNDGAQCDDGDLCTQTGVCAAGACSKGSLVDCSIFTGPCSQGVCDPTLGCVAEPKNEGSVCDDGLSVCSYGLCEAGACAYYPKNDGAMCDDGDFIDCTQGVCESAQCKSMPANDGAPCEDFKFDACTDGQCLQGLCVSMPANEGGPCDDYLFCNIGETCSNGLCVGGQPNPCAPPGGCWIASCDENADVCFSMPGNDGAVCDDFNGCTDGTTCSNGACIGGMPTNEGGACEDGASCTTGETCTAGLCGGGIGPQVFFADDFSDNAKGWILGPEWGIGPAMMSVGGAHGADPAIDHSPSGDNGVAGVVIGGNASTFNLHSYYYLESPPFNTANAPGKVYFTFYRWLNSDYDPYMHNSIDVWNGQTWVNLWTTGSFPGIEDSPPGGLGWTYIEHDVTAYKNAAMRVRFGFDIQSAGVYTIGSWNVDDVLVADAPCPP
jgi:hypothetical protein